MNLKKASYIGGLSLIGFMFVASKTTVAELKRPNIIIIYTDDQGYPDLGCLGANDLKTPNIDQLAATGVRFTDAYVTAPQCMPSRAGILTGKYQQSFGLYDNNSGPLPLDELTIGNRLQNAGYITASVGKWHQQVGVVKNNSQRGYAHYHGGPEMQPGGRGFTEYFSRAHMDRSEQYYWASHNLEGEPLRPDSVLYTPMYRIDAQTKAAMGFIDRHRDEPFFLYLAYFAPHVPLDASEQYLNRFPDIDHPKRKLCAAMLAAIDDGVGSIVELLHTYDIDKNTLVIFMSDNGAPANMSDGSVNDPLRGFKGTLFEGGIRVPLIMNWADKLPSGMLYDKPVISLDLTATSIALATDSIPNDMHGINLIPILQNNELMPERSLFWKWQQWSAIRTGDLKLVLKGDQSFLFNLKDDMEEAHDLSGAFPSKQEELLKQLKAWEGELEKPQLPVDPKLLHLMH